MARARIQINGVTQTTATVAIGGLVLLSNDDEGGELTYGWAFIDQPEGTADTFDNSAIENPSFTPTKEGTYLIRLVVNSGTGTQSIATATVAVLDSRTRERVPAAGEIVETDAARGWATAMNRSMLRALRSSVDANLVIAQTPGSIAPGQIVTLTGTATFNSATQAAFDVVQVATALGTVEHLERLGVMIDGVTPGVFGAGALVLVRMFGLVPFSATGSPAVGAPVFLSDSGAPALTAGTVQRVIGYVVAASVGSYQWVIDSGVGLTDGSVTSAKIVNGTIATVDIGNNQITNALLAQMPANTIKGNNTAGTTNAADLTPAQLRAMLGGNWLNRQILSAASGTYTPTSGTTRVLITMIGGGGGGGGANAGSTSAAAGAGGSSGVLLVIALGTAGTTLTGGAFVCGSGGTAGSTAGGNGGTGNDTTIVINTVTITAKGGSGGNGSTGTTGNALVLVNQPAAGTTSGGYATFGLADEGIIIGGAGGTWQSGEGGSTAMGAGGSPVGATTTGNNGSNIGFGGGGSGGAAQNVSSRAGGAGAAGGIIIDEYA